MTFKKNKNYKNFKAQTKLVRGGLSRSFHGETSEAIYMNSGYVFNSAEEAKARFSGELDGYLYSRYGNPTVTMFEERMALTEWLTHAKETNHSIHKNRILTVANANDSLAEYYGNIKEHLKQRKWKLIDERKTGIEFAERRQQEEDFLR